MPPHLALLLQTAPASPWWDIAKWFLGAATVPLIVLIITRSLNVRDKDKEAQRVRNEKADVERETIKDELKKLREGHDNHEKRFEGLVRSDEKLGDRVEKIDSELLKTRELANENKGNVGFVKEGLQGLQRDLKDLGNILMGRS